MQIKSAAHVVRVRFWFDQRVNLKIDSTAMDDAVTGPRVCNDCYWCATLLLSTALLPAIHAHVDVELRQQRKTSAVRAAPLPHR